MPGRTSRVESTLGRLERPFDRFSKIGVPPVHGGLHDSGGGIEVKTRIRVKFEPTQSASESVVDNDSLSLTDCGSDRARDDFIPARHGRRRQSRHRLGRDPGRARHRSRSSGVSRRVGGTTRPLCHRRFGELLSVCLGSSSEPAVRPTRQDRSRPPAQCRATKFVALNDPIETSVLSREYKRE